MPGLADAGRHGLDPYLMPYSDADASPFDLEFGQVVALQQIDQFLNLLRLGCGILGALWCRKTLAARWGFPICALCGASSGSPNALHIGSRTGVDLDDCPNFQIERDLNGRACFDHGRLCAA